MKTDRDYFLGTHDEELLRLGLQHRVWGAAVRDCWQRAGIGAGSRVLDVGAGPGYAAADFAQIVGPTGEVVAVERSGRYVEAGRAMLAKHGFANVRYHELDLMTDPLPGGDYDFAWCRWVACFVSSPALLVDKIAAALRPGGLAIFHEYLVYETFCFAPPHPRQREFAQQVMKGWRAAGGEPNVAQPLLRLLEERGFAIREAIPRIYCLRPADEMWQWPASFIRIHLEQQTAQGAIEASWAEAVRQEFAAAETEPATMLVTPLVLQIIAGKP
ncbi:MAG: methyltransferase domain-containing protein [Steroidobacteraceae bacterium]|nr:methyltransferase domain-containing protein [Steroidobacteraceae bacterium]